MPESPQQWEADHQRTALERLGLGDEFALGCDSIDAVAEALLVARREATEHHSTIARLRDKNRELNRRAQAADAGFNDAKKMVSVKGEWKGGGFGRAFLAYHNYQLEQELDAARDAFAHVVTVLGPEPAGCGDCCEGCLVEMAEALDAAETAIARLDKEPEVKADGEENGEAE